MSLVPVPTTSLTWLTDLRLSDVLEELISLALVDRDARTNKLSIHRLVQAEYRYYSVSTLQFTFDDTSKLLYEAFPKQIHGRTFEPHFEVCALLIQHVYFVRDFVGLNPGPGITLQPSKEFCRLMCNGAYYLVEKGAAKELHAMISVTMDAFKHTNLMTEDPLAYAHLCNSAALEKEMSGEFAAAKTMLETARDIRCKELPVGHEDIWVIMNNFGNLSLSLEKYDDALHYHLICQDTIAKHVEKNVLMNTINLGRAYTYLGRYMDALKAFSNAKEMNGKSEPVFRYALMSHPKVEDRLTGYRGYYYWIGNLHLVSGDIDEASKLFSKGRERLRAAGESISADMAVCLYKLGVIALRTYYASRHEDQLDLAV